MVISEKVNVVYPKLGCVAGWKVMTSGDGVHANPLLTPERQLQLK